MKKKSKKNPILVKGSEGIDFEELPNGLRFFLKDGNILEIHSPKD